LNAVVPGCEPDLYQWKDGETEMTVQAHKAELRKQMEAARASLSAEERAEESARACAAAIRLLEERGDDADGRTFTLFSYVPFRTELDVTPVMEWCWNRGGTIVVPKVIREHKLMSLHQIKSLDELESGRWGIREPAMSTPVLERLEDIDCVLVPGLAFDGKGGRLGYGGGYYDAFMRMCRENTGREPFKLAVAFDLQLISEVPMDHFDFRTDAVVTDRRTCLIR
jgi:5-formyltetrahydrofolate cyclo-ligase